MSILTNDKSAVQLSRSQFFSMTFQSGVLTIRPGGPRLGECEASVIAPEVKNAVRQKSRALKGLVLDLSNIEVVSSYGLGLCIELRNFAKGLRADTVLMGMSPDIREVIRIMKLDRLFQIALSPDMVVTPQDDAGV